MSTETGALHAVDFGDSGYVVENGQRWNGVPGELLRELPEPPTSIFVDPLMLVAMLETAANVEDHGPHDVDGYRCDLLVAECDLTAAADARPAVPIHRHLACHPSLVPLGVFITPRRTIARIRWRTDYGISRNPDRRTTFDVDFLEFGVVVDIDWSRLPTLKPAMSLSEKIAERLGLTMP